jgi:hypothetical protein
MFPPGKGKLPSLSRFGIGKRNLPEANMKTHWRLRAASCALTLAMLSVPVLAQVGVSAITTGFSVGNSEPGMPYTAEYKTTTVHKLANGVTITRSSTSLLARDSEGRTRQEQSIDFGSVNTNRKFVSVNDPSSNTILSWNTSVPEALVTHLPTPDEMRARAKAAKVKSSSVVSASANALAVTTAQITQGSPIHSSMQRESLGSKTIDGVVAEGERITTTMPAGAIGNDQPLVSTSETWRSTELNLIVLEIHDDPQNGTTTRELVNLDRGEPDPSLFRAPEGYTVKDQSEPK